ncbi:MAG: hypothetical protein ACRDLV_08240 [Solirubrobacteraceae bacterium]
MSSGSAPSTVVSLPPGVTVGPGRETSQVDAQGMITQGMAFPITLANGTTTSIFVPYSQLTDVAAVRQLIVSRVQAITAISS